MVELDFGYVVFCGGRKPENPGKNPSRDRERREPGEGWIGTQAGTSHHCAMSSLNMIDQIKVIVHFRGVSRTSDVARPVYTVDT